MIKECLHLNKRIKQGQVYFYCSLNHSVIDFFSCFGCVNKKYKKITKLTAKTKIKSVSKKRITVNKKTYKEVYERCNAICSICGTSQYLHLHNIDGRGKDKTDNSKNCIMLCSYCHLEVVHKNNKYWKKKLKEMV